MYRKKHAFSLLEILIAFVLAGILFGCIFSNFYQTYKLRSKIDQAHATVLNRQGLQLHLHTLLAQLLASSPQDDNENAKEEAKESKQKKSPTSSLFYTDNIKGTNALCFSFTCDYASDQRFIGSLTHYFYHDEKNHILQLLTRNNRGDEVTEAIMHNVKSCEISLFDPEKMIWVHTWAKGTEYQPTLLKLSIVEVKEKQAGNSLEFAFSLPSARQALVFTP